MFETEAEALALSKDDDYGLADHFVSPDPAVSLGYPSEALERWRIPGVCASWRREAEPGGSEQLARVEVGRDTESDAGPLFRASSAVARRAITESTIPPLSNSRP